MLALLSPSTLPDLKTPSSPASHPVGAGEREPSVKDLSPSFTQLGDLGHIAYALGGQVFSS